MPKKPKRRRLQITIRETRWGKFEVRRGGQRCLGTFATKEAAEQFRSMLKPVKPSPKHRKEARNEHNSDT